MPPTSQTHEGTNPGTCSKPGCLGGHEPGRCTGHASDGSGRPCKRFPVRGTNVCPSHGAGAPQVVAAARLRILEHADEVAAALVRLALSEKTPPAVRVTAARDLLDRADLGATRKVDLRTDLSDEQAVERARQLVLDEVAAQREKRDRPA